MPMITGLYTALITPFDETGSFHEQGFRENVQYQLANRVDGLVVLGTTAEAPTLTHHEKKRIIEIAREEIKDQTKLLVGTGSYSTEQSIENTKLAATLGADGVLVIAPYYNKPSQEGLYLHFKEIAKATGLPLVLYNNPGRCGTSLSIETMRRLAEIPTVVGIKEITSDIERLNQITYTFKHEFPHFSVLCGDDSATFTFLAVGAQGLISVASNLVPNAMKEFVDTCLAEDFPRARKLHFQLFQLFNALTLETNPVPIKAAMNLLGFAAGPCRLPLCDLSAEHKDKLQKILNGLHLSLLNLTIYS